MVIARGIRLFDDSEQLRVGPAALNPGWYASPVEVLMYCSTVARDSDRFSPGFAL